MGRRFITADHHFGHANIIRLCNRPYENVHEMNKALIENWNSVVKPEDDVWHLGDFAYKGGRSSTAHFARQLNGRIHLIMGNHDKPNLAAGAGFASIHQYFEHRGWLPNKQKVILFHYPLESWLGAFHGAVHFHGHCHGNLERKLPGRMDVSVDCTGYKPILLEEALERVPSGAFSESL